MAPPRSSATSRWWKHIRALAEVEAVGERGNKRATNEVGKVHEDVDAVAKQQAEVESAVGPHTRRLIVAAVDDVGHGAAIAAIAADDGDRRDGYKAGAREVGDGDLACAAGALATTIRW